MTAIDKAWKKYEAAEKVAEKALDEYMELLLANKSKHKVAGKTRMVNQESD